MALSRPLNVPMELPEQVGGNPAFRLGERAPAEVVNIAYVQAPVLTSTNAVMLLDRSWMTAENGQPVGVTEKTMYVQEDGGRYYLVDEQGQRFLPASDWLVTNVFYPHQEGGVTTYQPLYWRAKARFCHYEIDPPLLTPPSSLPYGGFGQLRVYQGRHIRLLAQGEPVSFPHLICLEPVATNLWRVYVFLPMLDETIPPLTLAYHRSSPDGKDRRPHHQEAVNPEPYFERQFAEKGQSITPGSNKPQFMVHTAIGSDQYQIEVTEAPTILPEQSQGGAWHKPLWARVRVVATEGGQSYASIWKAVSLVDLPNLYPVLRGPDAQPVFIERDNRALRQVFVQAGPAVFGRDWLQHQAAAYSVEMQVWNGTAWTTPNPSTEGFYPVSSGYDPVLVYTTRSCGLPDTSPGLKTLRHRSAMVSLRVQGGASWVNPAEDINACNPAPGVYAQVTVPQGLVQELTNNNAADAHWLVNLLFPPRSWRPTVDDRLEDGLYFYSGIIRQMDQPATTTRTIRVDFVDAQGQVGAVYTLDDVTITMGRYGDLVALRLIRPDGTTQALTLPQPQTIQHNTALQLRRYYLTLSDVQAKGLELDVRPWIWLVREVSTRLLFIRIHWTNEWQKGLEIVNVEAWQRVPAEAGNWQRQARVPVRIRPGMAEQLSLRTILSQKGLLPPQGVPTGSVRYRIQLESAEPLEDIATATMQPIQMSGTPGALRHRLSPLLARIFWDNRL